MLCSIEMALLLRIAIAASRFKRFLDAGSGGLFDAYPKRAWKKALQLNAKTPVSIENGMMNQLFCVLTLIVCYVTSVFPKSEAKVFRIRPKQ